MTREGPPDFEQIALSSIPKRPRGAVAQLVYVNGATSPSYVILQGV